MFTRLFFTISILITFIYSYAQPVISPEQKTMINELFEPWEGNQVPGIAMGIVHKDKNIYKRSAGLADLSTKELVSGDTKFQLSNMSQQFVVFGILLMQEEGKLDLDADMRSILPELKEFDHTITINHLLSATSGLHDFWSLKYLGGWRATDIISQEDVIQFIENQEKLDFKPGTQFELSYTDISILAMILERVSGKSLNDHLNEVIFKPLGMKNTSFRLLNNMPSSNLAKPYIKDGDSYVSNPMQINIAGPLNLFSSVNDMSKWYANFYSKKLGGKSAIEQLNSYAQLDNGATYRQARGTLTLGKGYEHPERGISKIYQNGWTGSYTVSVYNFATEDMIGFVFSNGGVDYNGHLPMIALTNILDDKFPLPSTTDFSQMKTLDLSQDELEKYTGHYWSNELSLSREILIEDDTLRYSRGTYSTPLVPIGENLFQMKMPSDDQIFVSFENGNGKKRFKFKTPSSDASYSDHYEKEEFNTKELKNLEGAYVNASNGFVYKVKVDSGKIIVTHSKNETIELTQVYNDKFQASAWFIDQINFRRNEQGRVISLDMRGPGYGDISFIKMSSHKETEQ